MVRGLALIVVAVTALNAPIQCGHGSDGGTPEESAGDAIYDLAQQFHKSGNEDARKQTLRYLVEKYPSNRHTPAAKAELGER